MNEIIQGDCLEVLKTLPADSVDLVATDPPYGLSFMGKDWDTFKATKIAKSQVVNLGVGMRRSTKKENTEYQIWVEAWASECLRVMKPGAFLFYCQTPRQDLLHRAIAGLEDAGLDVGYTSIYWTYASGFPKAMNIGKAVDKRNGRERIVTGPSGRAIAKNPKATNYQGTATFSETAKGREKSKWATKGNSPLEGSYGGFQPKPAVEVIIVAMKPLSEKTYVDQALKRVNEEENILAEIERENGITIER